MKPVTISYLPGPGFAGVESFYANVRAWRTRYPLILFSEHKWDADTIQLKASPDILGSTERRHAKSNLVWLTALRILRPRDFTHMVYLEQDCRVAQHGWDDMMFREAFAHSSPQLAGSVVCHNMSSVNMEWTRRWTKFIARHANARFSIPCIGSVGVAEAGVPCMFLNGAIGIYDLPLMLQFFAPQLADGMTTQAAVDMPAWDVAVGRHMYDTYGAGIFDGRIKHLDCVYSGYGDIQTNEPERLGWLVTGHAVAIHQCKSAATGPLSEAELILEVGIVPAPSGSSEPDHGKNDTRVVPSVPASSILEVGIAEGREGLCCLSPLSPAVSQGHEAQGNAVRGATEDGINPVPTSIPLPEAVPEEVEYKSPNAAPTVDIFIVSFAKDEEWLWYCLKSIRRFCVGFKRVVVLTPQQEASVFARHRAEFRGWAYRWPTYKEAPAPLGFLHHMVQVCRADGFCKSDLVMHVDSDCVFHTIAKPSDYMHNGKPILQIEPYAHLKSAHPNRYYWKTVVDAALGCDATHETMTRHPSIYPRELYPLVREHIEKLHGKPFEDYVLGCHPTYPQGYCEFGTLGAFAMHSASMRERMHFVEGTQQPDQNHFVTTDGSPAPRNLLLQGHSHPKGDPKNMDNPHSYGPAVPVDINSHRKLIQYLEL